MDGATPAEHVNDLPAGRGAWVSDISPDGRTLLVTVWSSADLNNIYSYDLTTEGAELEPFIVGPERVWSAKFVGRSDYVIHEEDIAGHAHNIFLQVALDLGVPGLVAFLWLLFGVGHAAFKAFRRCSDPCSYSS